MATVQIIGVPFDGYGRTGHQAGAAAARREAGLLAAWPGHTVAGQVTVDLPDPSPTRGRSTSLINEPALLAMVESVGSLVGGAVRGGAFPVVVGGDCTTLLGTIPTLRAENIGLVFVDGHEDTMPLDVSEDGEAANTEIGLLLGLTGRLLPAPLAGRFRALSRERLALLGQRDVAWRQQFNVGSLRDHGVWMRDLQEVSAAPAACARAAVEHLLTVRTGGGCTPTSTCSTRAGVPGPGPARRAGRTGQAHWPQLEQTLTTAVALPGCVGLSVAIYDPDQDPGQVGARQIVALLTRLAEALAD